MNLLVVLFAATNLAGAGIAWWLLRRQQHQLIRERHHAHQLAAHIVRLQQQIDNAAEDQAWPAAANTDGQDQPAADVVFLNRGQRPA